jgi:Sulfotransferase domain
MSELRDRIGQRIPDGGKRAIRALARGAGGLTAGLRVQPDFLVVGTMRGGTTTLYHYLARHPHVAGAVLDKELHYFDLHYDCGPTWYRSRFPIAFGLDRAARKIGARPKVGEASPYYLFHPLVPERVAVDLPGARAVAMLRDPVERAWSHYRHMVDLGYESLSFQDAIEREPERLAGLEERLRSEPHLISKEHQHHSYVARGEYSAQIRRWWEHIDRDRLFIIRSEDFYRDPRSEFRKLEAFLEIPSWEPKTWRTYNAATSTDMPTAVRERLRDHFRPWNRELAELLGRDFGWDG